MFKNYKIITAVCIVILLIILSAVCVNLYIKSLKSQIKDLNNVILERDNTINQLNANIATLKLDIKSIKNTIAITDTYISNIEKIKSEEDAIKNAIYEEVLNDSTGEIKDWFNKKLPSDIFNTINDHHGSVCYDKI